MRIRRLAGFRYRKPISIQPRYIPDGGFVCTLPQSLVDTNDEAALIINFVARRQLFGHAYRMLQPGYFDQMPPNSGVFLRPLVLTHEAFPGVHRPGDIDLLIIPYENDELVLERAMAIEFKVVRASFMRQGKSPNDFGYSQASALLDIGIPHVAVGHLIVSDESPRELWREMMRCEILDNEGHVGNTKMVPHDMLPHDLMARALGRLRANNPSPSLGLLASYLCIEGRSSLDAKSRSIWIPEAQRARLNPRTRTKCLDAITSYFDRNAGSFLRTPRHDPPSLPRASSL